MNIFKQFIVSLYSPKDMASFRFQHFGKTILFVILISIISIIPISKFTISNLSTGIATMSEFIKNDLPEFKIENGKLTASEEKTVRHTQDDLTIVFDSANEVKAASLRSEGNAIGILKNEFVLVTEGNLQSTSYNSLGIFKITSKDIQSLFTQMDDQIVIINIIVIIAILLFALLALIIDISILALFGIVMRNGETNNLKYKNLWTLSAYAITIPTVFFTIMTALKTTVPSAFLINWAVSVLLLYLIMKESRSDEKISN